MNATTRTKQIALIALCGFLSLTGCGGGGGDDGSTVPLVDSSGTSPTATPQDTTPPNNPGTPDPSDDPGTPGTPPAHKNLFTPVSNVTWDNTAVRKVLHAFAFGGQASDAQIQAWADMAPEFAIEEMLTFDEHNFKLSPPSIDDSDRLYLRGGTLRELAEFWASDHPDNGVVEERRYLYDVSNTSGNLPTLWARAAMSRGLNPFRQKIGLWETNYHLAVNQMATGRGALLRYYDDIMEAHEAGLPYQDVLGIAAGSAAVALQYGHHTNRYRNDVCDCNEDFAREYHQLFFGILGMDDPDYHENVTIKNSAKAFTDMVLHHDPETGVADEVDFGTFYHPTGPLEILGAMVGGTNAAERIAEMVNISINHPESLSNLPVLIIQDLADDNLSVSKKAAVRTAWSSLSEKNLLTFLRGYAISTIFHDSQRIKHQSSIDRHILLSNLVGANNSEHYLNLYTPRHPDESVQIFFPTHNVFGSQTGMQAAASDLVFRKNFNLMTESAWRFRKSDGTSYGVDWEKDWAARIFPNASGEYLISEVAEWLWQHFMADGLKRFGPLERAHVYALLYEGRDLAYLVDANDAESIFSTADVLTNTDTVSLVESMANSQIALNDVDSDQRLLANRYVGMAINFIAGTPYIFAQEGR